MLFLENAHLKVWIKPKGAELRSLVNKNTGIEHIWDADPNYWSKSSPVLFPIVGGLKDDTYMFEGKSYSLPRHGFARDRMFDLRSQTKEKAVFRLVSDEETWVCYPFEFEFLISYELIENELKVSYQIDNKGNSKMYFSVGAHPAFSVPFADGEGYDNYFLEFESDEVLKQWPLTSEGLIDNIVTDIQLNNSIFPLTKKLFENDALVFKDLKSETILLKSKMSDNYLKFNFQGFPYFGIWAAKNANFVCLEPWCGIADGIDSNQELTEKEGINILESNAVFERTWSVELF